MHRDKVRGRKVEEECGERTQFWILFKEGLDFKTLKDLSTDVHGPSIGIL